MASSRWHGLISGKMFVESTLQAFGGEGLRGSLDKGQGTNVGGRCSFGNLFFTSDLTLLSSPSFIKWFDLLDCPSQPHFFLGKRFKCTRVIAL